MSEKYPSQLAERFQIRLPDGMRDRLRYAAEMSGRSMNAEIVHRLELTFAEPGNSTTTFHERIELEMAAERLLYLVREMRERERLAFEEAWAKEQGERAAPRQPETPAKRKLDLD